MKHLEEFVKEQNELLETNPIYESFQQEYEGEINEGFFSWLSNLFKKAYNWLTSDYKDIKPNVDKILKYVYDISLNIINSNSSDSKYADYFKHIEKQTRECCKASKKSKEHEIQEELDSIFNEINSDERKIAISGWDKLYNIILRADTIKKRKDNLTDIFKKYKGSEKFYEDNSSPKYAYIYGMLKNVSFSLYSSKETEESKKTLAKQCKDELKKLKNSYLMSEFENILKSKKY